MNAVLLENAVKYHGRELFDMILEQNNCQESKRSSTQETHRNLSNNDNIGQKEKDLQQKIAKFTAKKSDYLFSEKIFPPHEKRLESTGDQERNAKRLSQSTYDNKILEFYLPPIETFMNIPSDMRTEHLFKHIETDDIVISQMDYMSDSGIHMRMICFDDHKQKDLRNVKLNVNTNL